MTNDEFCNPSSFVIRASSFLRPSSFVLPGASLGDPGLFLDDPGGTLDGPGGSLDDPGASLGDPGLFLNGPGASLDDRGASPDAPGASLGDPGLFLDGPGASPDGPGASADRTGGLFHSGWAYRRDVFDRAGGYPSINSGEDQGLAERFQRLGVAEADPLALGFLPFLIYRWAGGMHLSWAGPRGYENWARLAIQPAKVEPSDPPVRLDEASILPGIHARLF